MANTVKLESVLTASQKRFAKLGETLDIYILELLDIQKQILSDIDSLIHDHSNYDPKHTDKIDIEKAIQIYEAFKAISVIEDEDAAATLSYMYKYIHLWITEIDDSPNVEIDKLYKPFHERAMQYFLPAAKTKLKELLGLASFIEKKLFEGSDDLYSLRKDFRVFPEYKNWSYTFFHKNKSGLDLSTWLEVLTEDQKDKLGINMKLREAS